MSEQEKKPEPDKNPEQEGREKFKVAPKDFRFPCPWCRQECVIHDTGPLIGKIWNGLVVQLKCPSDGCGKLISVWGKVNVNLEVNRLDSFADVDVKADVLLQ